MTKLLKKMKRNGFATPLLKRVTRNTAILSPPRKDARLSPIAKKANFVKCKPTKGGTIGPMSKVDLSKKFKML
jgi:hypothetical protein